MKKRLIATGVAVGVGTVVLASSAFAATVKVVVGTNMTGSFSVTAVNTTDHQLSVASGLVITCTSVTIPAASSGVPGSTVTAGASVTDVSTINRVNYSGCTAGGSPNPSVSSVGSWKLHYVSGATSSASDTSVQAKIDNAVIHVMAGSTCDIDVAGSIRGTFDESKQIFTIQEPGGKDGLLKTTVVRKNCQGGAAVGDGVRYTGTLKIDSPSGSVKFG